MGEMNRVFNIKGNYIETQNITVNEGGVVNFTEGKSAEEEPTAEDVPPRELACDRLHSSRASIMWQKLQEMGYIDSNYQPMISMRKASVIASTMGGLLGLSPLWEPFEMLWHTKNLANTFCQAQLGKYYGELTREIRNKLE